MPEKPSPPENYFQFEKLLGELARQNVDFAVVGSWREKDKLDVAALREILTRRQDG